MEAALYSIMVADKHSSTEASAKGDWRHLARGQGWISGKACLDRRMSLTKMQVFLRRRRRFWTESRGTVSLARIIIVACIFMRKSL